MIRADAWRTTLGPVSRIVDIKCAHHTDALAFQQPSNHIFGSSTSVTTIGSTKSSTPDKGIVPADNLVKKANGQKSVAATPSGFKFIFED
ncbi:hypothetical protein D6D17_03597 [Aureobasidium pullulans]|nr:hypothetical protein D6D17_03597 [Aureobasidium pullulans]THX86034.1 hypothetical protein D6D04_01641 [Aureobasidium pullulans]TIA76506.1 hypothetical protein D6C76_05645 [Aureobasidium pullulans]